MPAEVPNQARGLQPTKSRQMVSNLFRKQFSKNLAPAGKEGISFISEHRSHIDKNAGWGQE